MSILSRFQVGLECPEPQFHSTSRGKATHLQAPSGPSSAKALSHRVPHIHVLGNGFGLVGDWLIYNWLVGSDGSGLMVAASIQQCLDQAVVLSLPLRATLICGGWEFICSWIPGHKWFHRRILT